MLFVLRLLSLCDCFKLLIQRYNAYFDSANYFKQKHNLFYNSLKINLPIFRSPPTPSLSFHTTKPSECPEKYHPYALLASDT